jgi:hypothetical protein
MSLGLALKLVAFIGLEISKSNPSFELKEWTKEDQKIRDVVFLDPSPDFAHSLENLESGLVESECQIRRLQNTEHHALLQFSCEKERRSGQHELSLEDNQLRLRSVELPRTFIDAASLVSLQEALGRISAHPRVMLKSSQKLIDLKSMGFDAPVIDSCEWSNSRFISQVKNSVERGDKQCRVSEEASSMSYSCEAVKEGQFSIRYRFFWDQEACKRAMLSLQPQSQAGLKE